MPKRSPLVYGVALAIVIAIGIASRSEAAQRLLPGLVHKQLGDVLYAIAIFLLLRMAFRKLPTMTLGIAAFALSAAVEFFKLCTVPAVQMIRHTRLGSLTLGNGFLWSDFVCYLIGAGLCVLVERRMPGTDNKHEAL